MNKHFCVTGLLAITVFLYTPAGFAQDDETGTALPPEPKAEETIPESLDLPAGQEVEINEDNYRQFMELKDPLQQRNILPENAFKPRAGMQKLENLPEASQKHLRNQLREIIVQGDPWQPGDEDSDYPYVPSVAASTDPSLKNQEAEAWGELLDNYHQREAEIYANSSRSRAAAAAAGASGEGAGSGEKSGGGSAGQAGAGQQASQQSGSSQNSAAGSYSPNSSNDPNAKSTAGVSQNAMEFLQQNENQGANPGSNGTGSTPDNDGTGSTPDNDGTGSTPGNDGTGSTPGNDEQGDTQASAQAQAGQQSSDDQTRATSPPSSQASSNEPKADSTVGTSQNALEYLLGEDVQTGQPAPVDTEDTLTIEDLLNAQGVGDDPGAGSPPATGNDDEEPAENLAKKDGESQ